MLEMAGRDKIDHAGTLLEKSTDDSLRLEVEEYLRHKD